MLRGARQVGKSLLIRTWGRREFGDNFLEINLEEHDGYRKVFSKDLNTERILDELMFISGKNLRRTPFLLFIDEIQSEPQAIMSLRYFFEKQPHLHVIGAGSLIEFVLSEISFPVGRVDSLHLMPLDFFEFISALGHGHYAQSLRDLGNSPVPEAAHSELLLSLKKYLRVGGMPEAVKVFCESQDLSAVSRVHERLILSYQDDFAKYARQADWGLLETVFRRLPQLVGRCRVKYVTLDRDSRSYRLKKVLELLRHAGLVHFVYHTGARKPPLASAADPDVFKLLYIDVGLLGYVLGFDWSLVYPDADLTNLADGKFAEQFVGQEMIAAGSATARYQPHYWYRHKKGSDAEVDYIVECKGKVCPVEVKSGSRGTLKSLHIYCSEYRPAEAFILSQHNNTEVDHLKWRPLYMGGRLTS